VYSNERFYFEYKNYRAVILISTKKSSNLQSKIQR